MGTSKIENDKKRAEQEAKTREKMLEAQNQYTENQNKERDKFHNTLYGNADEVAAYKNFNAETEAKKQIADMLGSPELKRMYLEGDTEGINKYLEQNPGLKANYEALTGDDFLKELTTYAQQQHDEAGAPKETKGTIAEYKDAVDEAMKSYSGNMDQITKDYNAAITDSLKGFGNAAEQYLSNYSKKSDALKKDYDTKSSKEIKDARDSIKSARDELDATLAKYTGDQGYKGALSLAQEGATQSAANAASVAQGAARSAGMAKAAAAALGAGSAINNYNQELQNQQNQAANMYNSAANSGLSRFNTDSSNIMSTMNSALNTYGNSYNNALASAGNIMSQGTQNQKDILSGNLSAAETTLGTKKDQYTNLANQDVNKATNIFDTSNNAGMQDFLSGLGINQQDISQWLEIAKGINSMKTGLGKFNYG